MQQRLQVYGILVQIQRTINNNFFKTVRTDFLSKFDEVRRTGILPANAEATALNLKALSTFKEDEVGFDAACPRYIALLEAKKTKLKEEALGNKRWRSMWKWGTGSSVVINSLYTFVFTGNKGGWISLPLLVFGTLATTFLAGLFIYTCCRSRYTLPEFDQHAESINTQLGGAFREHLLVTFRQRGVSNTNKLGTYINKFDRNPDGLNLPLTINGVLERLINLKNQPERKAEDKAR